MYNYNTDSLELILEVFFLLVTVQEHCVCHYVIKSIII